jgi:hypothetical protein
MNFLKVKQSHNTPMKAQGERRYSSYSLTTSALDGGEWSASRPGRALDAVKGPPVPIGQEARRKKPLPLPGIEPRSPGRAVRSQTLH